MRRYSVAATNSNTFSLNAAYSLACGLRCDPSGARGLGFVRLRPIPYRYATISFAAVMALVLVCTQRPDNAQEIGTC